MSCLLFANDEESNTKINIDELFERNQSKEMRQLSIFNKILNRIHKRITFTSRFKPKDQHIWFTVPEYIFGEPIYDNGDCIGFLFKKLEENGFNVRYVHPNTMFITWNHWIPSYVRQKVKKETGMVIDERGNIISKKEDADDNNLNNGIFNDNRSNKDTNQNGQKQQREYTSVSEYKPTGNLIYNKDMFEKLEKKVSFQP
uniref:Uncharacterized protein n=1 Tax=viral metagenome TaxID=1070528 RepID=A0A6C0DSG6_9ZZZZ